MDLFAVIALFVALVLLIPLSWIWPPNSPWAPWWRTSSDIADKAFNLAKLTKKDVVYELGSGEATALIVAAKKFGAKGIGIEIDPLRFYLSKFTVWRNGLNNQIKLIRGDLFKEDLSEATVVFVYLVPKTLNLLKPKLLKELKPGTKIISIVYKIPGGLTDNVSKDELKPKGLIKSLSSRGKKEIFIYVVPK